MSEYTISMCVSDVYSFQKYITSTLPTLQAITQDFDRSNCTLTFSSFLNAANLTTLQSVISSYTNTSTVEYVPDLQSCVRAQFYGTSFVRVQSWQYQGTKYKNLSKVVILSRLEPQTSSDISNNNFYYTMRVVNITGNTVLGTATFTNSTDVYNTINLSNNSNDESTIELQVKKNASVGLFVEINAITFFMRSV